MSRSNPICRAWQPMISGACARLRIGGVVALMAIMLSCSATFAVAEDVGTHTSDLIRGLLPTVVNIAVTESVVPRPPPFNASTGDCRAASDAGIRPKTMPARSGRKDSPHHDPRRRHTLAGPTDWPVSGIRVRPPELTWTSIRRILHVARMTSGECRCLSCTGTPPRCVASPTVGRARRGRPGP